MDKDAKNRTLIINHSDQGDILLKYYKLGTHNMYNPIDYDYYCNQLKSADFKNDIDERYRLSCINLLVKGYKV